jgi:hypothetical protein
MKGKRRVFAFSVAGLLLLSFLATPVSAGTTRTEFEGWSTPQECPWCAPGRVWVSEDWVLHIRGMQEYDLNDYSDPRIAGSNLVTVNVNMQLPEVYGPMWGTAHIEKDDGYWEGSWVGYRTAEGGSYIQEILHGHGAYEGLQARLDLMREDPNAPFWVEGVIMDPGGD